MLQNVILGVRRHSSDTGSVLAFENKEIVVLDAKYRLAEKRLCCAEEYCSNFGYICPDKDTLIHIWNNRFEIDALDLTIFLNKELSLSNWGFGSCAKNVWSSSLYYCDNFWCINSDGEAFSYNMVRSRCGVVPIKI